MAKFFREFRTLTKDALAIARRNYLASLAFVVATGIAAALALPHSQEWLRAIQVEPESAPTLHSWAKGFSELGELQNATLGLSILFWIGAAWKKRPDLRIAGTACALAGILAGILVNVLRPMFGRPRPCTDIADGFYYWTFEWEYNAFPSGHSMSNFASATALVILKPVVGVPYFAVCFAIAWSRMQLDRHDPTDVSVGALLGIGIGLLIGLAARGLIRKGDSLAPTTEGSPSASARNSGPLPALGHEL